MVLAIQGAVAGAIQHPILDAISTSEAWQAGVKQAFSSPKRILQSCLAVAIPGLFL